MTSDLQWCDDCRDYHWRGRGESCKPQWLTWIEDIHEVGNVDDCRGVRADDAETAARSAVERCDDATSEGYSAEQFVEVALASSPTFRWRFRVVGRLEVVYRATELK